KTRGLYAGFGEFYTSIVILWQALPPVSAGFRQCLNTAHHCLQTVAAGGAQVVEQVEFGKVTLDIKIAHFSGRFTVIGCQYYGQQPLDDKSIAVGGEIEPAIDPLGHQPNPALATAHQILVGIAILVQGRQLTTQVDNVL